MIPFTHFQGSGPQLHLAHANAYPPGCYQELIDELVADFDVWAVDHRPLWPGSQPEEIETWGQIASDMISFLNEHELDGVIGVGHSLGAVVTLMAAVSQPELFRSLVLIEPVFFMPEYLAEMEKLFEGQRKEEIPIISRALRRRYRWPSHEAAFARFRSKEVFARLPNGALWQYVEAGTEPHPEGGIRLRYSPQWEAQIYGLPPAEVWDLLPQVKHPTLAVRGAHSDTLSPAAWALWQETQPSAAFLELAETDHLVPLSHPVDVAEAIRAFQR